MGASDSPAGDTTDYRRLLTQTDGELGRLDVARLNLLCTLGLPGAERVDVDDGLRTLDRWAGVVRGWTDAAHRQFYLPDPARYGNSEPAFRLVALHTALHRHCGVRYDPDKIGARPGDPFHWHDMSVAAVTHGPGGTCATLPVVYAAVGRRLGYPVRLALARAHVFCRWDDPAAGVRVNLDGGNTPNVRPDAYYRGFPVPLAPREEETFGYLRSLTPRQELAVFVGARGWAWETHGAFARAVDEFHAAGGPDDPWPRYPSCVRHALDLWREKLKSEGRVIPTLLLPAVPTGPRRWPGMPWPLEADVLRLEAAEQLALPSRVLRWDDSTR